MNKYLLVALSSFFLNTVALSGFANVSHMDAPITKIPKVENEISGIEITPESQKMAGIILDTLKMRT